jgi:tetratricopeptide (TPR) repeat protein
MGTCNENSRIEPDNAEASMISFARFVLISTLLVLFSGPLNLCRAADPDVTLWIARANAAADEISDLQARNLISDPLARMLARSGDVADALETAKGIVDPLPKIYVLTAAAKAAHQAGNHEICQQAVEAGKQDAIDNAGPFYTQAYIDLCFAAGMPEAAMEYADQLFQADGDPQPYLDIAQGYATSGNTVSAEKLLEGKHLGDYGNLSIVKGLTNAKDFDAAINVADAIKEPQISDLSREQLAVALAHADHEEAAIQQANLISNAVHRDGLLGEVALFSSKNDSVDELRKRFDAANTRDTKTALLGPLVMKLVEIGALDEAEQAIEAGVESIKMDPREVSASKFGVYGDDSEIVSLRAAHLEIAKKLIEQDDMDKAATQVAKVEPLYDVLPEEAALIKWPVTPALINTLIQLGELKRAEEKLASIQSSFSRVGAAVPLAVHYIKSGEVEKGLVYVAPSGDEEQDHGSEFDAVAIALLESVSAARAAEFLESLSQTQAHGQAITGTARELVESKQLDKLEQLYATAKSPFVRTLLATEAANRLLPKAK